jgi:hypothetical protein
MLIFTGKQGFCEDRHLRNILSSFSITVGDRVTPSGTSGAVGQPVLKIRIFLKKDYYLLFFDK